MVTTTTLSQCCRSCASLDSNSAAPRASRENTAYRGRPAPLAWRASDLRARRNAVAGCHVVAASAPASATLSTFSPSSPTSHDTRKNLAVSVLGLGRATALLPARPPRKMATASALPNSSSANSDLPPAPVRTQHLSPSSFHEHGPPASLYLSSSAAAAAAASRRLVAVNPRGSAAFAAAAGSGLRLRPRGALSALLFLAALGGAMIAAAASLVASNTRSCEACKGFGVCRCPVCGGRGLVAFEGKYIHSGDACPRCLGSRLISCPECGGLVGRRPLFSHARSPRASAGVASSVDPGAGLRIGEDGKRKSSRRMRTGELFAALVGRKVSGRVDRDNDDEEEEDDNRRWLGFGAQQTLGD